MARLALLASLAASAALAHAVHRPNIVFIQTDDRALPHQPRACRLS